MCIVSANTLPSFRQIFGGEIVIPPLLERFRYLFRVHSIFWGEKNIQKNRQTRAQLNSISVDWKKMQKHIYGEAKKSEKEKFQISRFRKKNWIHTFEKNIWIPVI